MKLLFLLLIADVFVLAFTMSDATIQVIVGAVAPVIASVAAAIVVLRKTDRIEKKTDEIHAVTNSAKAEADIKLDSANERIENLQKLLTAFVDRNGKKSSEEKPRTP